MPSRVLAVAIIIALILSIGMQGVKITSANPTWGTSTTPIPPITDPPLVIINSPSSTVNSNPVPLNITIIQPDSWISKHNMTLPNSWVDNSDSVVVGQNKIESVSCIIDGHSTVLWNGTYFGFAVTYYLPRVTEFSADINVGKGQHSLQINVVATSDYAIAGIIPFAYKKYNISANQSITFSLLNGSESFGSPKVDNIESSYAIWQSSTIITPSPTITNSTHSTKLFTPEFIARALNESTVELVITNQEFTKSDSVNALFYDYRVKNHNSEIWALLGGIGQLQSDSKTTTITVKTPYPSDYPFTEGMKQVVNSTSLDFQVRAKTGNYTIVNKQSGTTTYFNDSDTSNWSNLQTVDLSQPLSQHSTTTTQDLTTYLLPISITVALVILGVVVYQRRKIPKTISGEELES